jgi:hypothetical protein
MHLGDHLKSPQERALVLGRIQARDVPDESATFRQPVGTTRESRRGQIAIYIDTIPNDRHLRGRQSEGTLEELTDVLANDHKPVAKARKHSEPTSSPPIYEGEALVLDMNQSRTHKPSRHGGVDERGQVVCLDNIHLLSTEEPIETR